MLQRNNNNSVYTAHVPLDQSAVAYYYYPLITCVIARSNPRRLLPIWREKLCGHYHVTMTSACDVDIIASTIRP